MAALPYLPLYVGEILTTSVAWDGEARALYLVLQLYSWADALPADQEKLARVIGYDMEKLRQLWPTVSSQFEIIDGKLRNPRLEELRGHADRLQEQRAKASRAGVEGRARKRIESGPNPTQELPLGLPPRSSDGQPPGQPDVAPLGQPLGLPIRSGQVRSDAGKGFGVLEDSDSCPLERPARTRLAYETKAFHDAVVAAYHEILPELPTVRTWETDRAKALTGRIRERMAAGKPADTIEYWRKLFTNAATNDHWCGRKPDSTWRANLEWFLKPANFRKIIEWEPPPARRGMGANHGR